MLGHGSHTAQIELKWAGPGKPLRNNLLITTPPNQPRSCGWACDSDPPTRRLEKKSGKFVL